MKRLPILLIPPLMFVACSGNKSEKVEPAFDIDYTPVEISGFVIDEVLKPIDMCMNDNYLCILSEEKGNGDQIFVFDADDLDFKYKFARRGTGPEETLALDMVKRFRGDTIDLIDQANYRKLTYLLTDEKPIFIGENHLSLPPMGPLQEVYWINDSILIFNNSWGDLITYNDNSGSVIDQVNLFTHRGMDENEAKRFGSFHFAIQDNSSVVVGTRFFNEILKLPLTDSYTFDISSLTETPDCESIDIDNIYNNYTYFAFLNAGQDYILAQYYGKKMKETQRFPLNMGGRDLKYDLLLLDSDLKPLRKYDAGTDILRVFLDEQRHRIYFLEANEDFEKLKYISF